MFNNAGELRTKIRIQAYVPHRPAGSLQPVRAWADIGNESPGDPPRMRRCKWQNIHGSEVWEADKVLAESGATLMVRHDPRIDAACRILKMGDARPYEIVSVDNVFDRGAYMEIKVRRAVAGD